MNCVLHQHNVPLASQRYQIDSRSHGSYSMERHRASDRHQGRQVQEFSREGKIAHAESDLKQFGQLFDRKRQDEMIAGQTTIGGNQKRCVGCSVAWRPIAKCQTALSGNVAQNGELKSRMAGYWYSETHRSLGVDDVKR